MKNTLFVIIVVLVNISLFCQENISFPLEIGNKFFYKAGYYPDNGYYGVVKTIVDSLTDGTRVIESRNFYKDSININYEYWRQYDNKLYSSNYSNNLGYPIYNGNFLQDSCINNFSSSTCYELGDTVVFNQKQNYQLNRYSSFNKIEAYKINYLTVENIGIYYRYRSTSSSQRLVKDSISLKAYMVNGVLIGDSVLTDFSTEKNYIVTSFRLFQNYPNPFNPTTKIEYIIPKTAFVTMKVYDILGREVVTLVNEEKTVGKYNAEFDGTKLSSGIYFYKIQAGDYSSVKKMILIK